MAAAGRLMRPLRSPLVPLALLVLQLGVVYGQRSRMHEWRAARAPDTESYIQASEATTWIEAVSHYRTFGYPLFLKLVGAAGLTREQVPELQFGLYGTAVLGFWLALLLYTGSPWLAFAGATSLPWAYVVDLMPEIMTDSLAAALTLAVVALVVALARRPAAWPLWLALGLAVFATYQVRPAAVFLIGWVPVSAAVLRVGWEGRLPPRLVRWVAGLALLTVVPWLAFAGARALTVGHFGLVSFGGTNLAGVAACFLDEELIAELPEEHRGLASGMLRIRQRRYGWQAMTADADTFDYFLQYSNNIFRVSLTAARAQLKREDARREAEGLEPDRRPGRVRRNEMLEGAARAILGARPRLYFKWVRDSFLYGIRSLADRPWVVWPAVLLALSAPWLLVGRRRAAPAGSGRGWPVVALLFAAVSYFLLYLVLVALVSWPFPRYFSAIVLLLPSGLCLTLLEVWRRLAARAQSR